MCVDGCAAGCACVVSECVAEHNGSNATDVHTDRLVCSDLVSSLLFYSHIFTHLFMNLDETCLLCSDQQGATPLVVSIEVHRL